MWVYRSTIASVLCPLILWIVGRSTPCWTSDVIAAAPHLLAQGQDVAIRDLPFPAPTVESLLYWHRNAESDPGSQWMRSELRRLFAGSAGPVSRAGRGKRP